MFESFLQPKHCYKVDALGLITLEIPEASVRFFNNPAMMHVMIPQHTDLNVVLRPWAIDINTRSLSIHQEFRIIFWTQEIWLIMSMNQSDFYSLVVHLDFFGYELSSSMSPVENESGFLEMFPFCSPYLRTVRKLVVAEDNG